MPKGTSRDEAMLNSEKIKPVTLHVIKLHLSEGIRQAGRKVGRQLVSQQKFLLIYYKFCNNLLEAFRVVLKAFLSLVIPNQHYQGTRVVL